MTVSTIDDSQRNAARLAGFLYLFLMATGVFAFYVRSGLIVSGDAAATASNIMASERLFRISTAVDLLTAAGEAALAVALYVLLKPVHRSLALLAAFWRVTDGALLAVTTLSSFVVLLLLSRASYLRAFRTDQLQALARLSLSAYGTGFTIAFVFLALGATVFSYLLFKSRYIPRALAAWGIFSYVVMLIGALTIIIFPNLARTITPGYYAPAGIFEVVAGIWLLFKGVNAANWGWFSTTLRGRSIGK